MSDVALRMDGVYKKFRKGELYDSLRDLIPALTGRMFRRKELDPNDSREFWALEDISFEVKKGEAFAIIGHNGAGKSTILKVLSQIMRPTKGQMIVNGRLSALIEVSAGFHQDLTGRENVYLNGAILGMSRREIDDKLDAIVEFSGLSDFIDTPVKRYSSGMFARLGFSVAAHVDPDVLIVDEVLSVGDYVFQQKCIAKMTEVINGGTTVLFVSHNLRAVADLCARGLLLNHGKVQMIGETGELINRYMETVRYTRESDAEDKAVRLKKVTLRRKDEECVKFESMEKAWLDIEAVAQKPVKNMAVSVYLTDENRYLVFDTSTERLGYDAISLNPGETFRCTFELELNMAYGAYYISVGLLRYDIQQFFDAWQRAVTLFIDSRLTGFIGIVNCKPVVTEQTIEGPDGRIAASN